LDREPGWSSRLALEHEFKPVLVQDLLDQRQAYSLAVLLCAEERSEKIGAHLGTYSAASIFNLHKSSSCAVA
jgi:hypothetical protein